MDNLFEFEINPEEMLEGAEPQEDISTNTSEEVVEDIEIETEESESEKKESEDDGAVKYFYDFIVENGIIDEVENFDGSIETLRKEIEQLPYKSFKRAVDNLPPVAQKVVNYVFAKEDVDVNELKSFLDDDIGKIANEIVINDEESARSFLEKQYRQMRIYSDDDDMEEAIDLLEERGTLIKTAKQLANKVNEDLRSELDNKLQQLESEKQERFRLQQEQNEKMIQSINNTLEELPWNDKRKSAVIENLKPEVLQSKNEKIRMSPKAIVQLADLYSYFDEDKGEFNFQKLIDDKATSKVNTETKKRMQEDKFSSAVGALGKQLPNRKEKSILEVVDFDYNY